MSELMLINPRKRRKPRRKTGTRAVRKTYRRKRRRNPALAINPRRRRQYKRRRNPIKANFKDIFSRAVIPAATAAAGALTLDVLMGFLPIPDNFKSGSMRHFVKGVGAIGMGILASNFVKSKTAELFTTGALTVTIYDAGKEMLSQYMPNLSLGEYGEDDLDGLGYQGAGYPGEDEELMGLGYQNPDEYDGDMAGLGMDMENELEL